MPRTVFVALVLLLLTLCTTVVLSETWISDQQRAADAAEKAGAKAADLSAAKANYDQALLHMTSAQKDPKDAFESSDDYVAAKKALDDAVAAVAQAKAAALTTLKKSADYKAAVDSRDSAQKNLDSLKASGDASRQDISAAADKVFKNSSVPSRMENDAYAAEPGVKEAETGLKAAREKKTQLETAYKKALQNDQAIKDATVAVQQAKQALSAAEISSAAAQDQKNDTQAVVDRQRVNKH